MNAVDDIRHIALQDVQSTNLECLERARAGDPGNLWITANRQLGGRARRGRNWISEPGNLYASLLLIDPSDASNLASLPLAVAVAVHSAICQVLPPASQQPVIKWPNDILVNGAKISGILLESETLRDGKTAVVIGCGINVAHAPDNVMYPTTTLHAMGATASPEELFAHLCQTMAAVLKDWDRGSGIASIRRSWLDRAEGVGQRITVKLPNRSVSGQFRDIDRAGCLVLMDDERMVQTIAAGDVFFE